MPQPRKKCEPIRESVRVDCPIEDAFRLFTEEFSAWWPLALYSITGEKAETCTIEPGVGGRVFERTRSGEEHEWGSVTGWDPPERVTFTWNPGGPDDGGQTVDVEFKVEADGTRVTVIHSGWETTGVAVCALQMGGAQMWSILLHQCLCEFAADQMLATA
jgi:Activator of Hsp90 ATPase homolog 1-like protein